jgi:hypothetical protein
MTETLDTDLCRRTWELLQPGEIALDGLVVHTDFDGSRETAMHQTTVEVGGLIAEHAGHDPAETFVYSGTEDPEFASNQHQGLTLDDESFVWECQQLLRDGSFDLVFYFRAEVALRDLLADAREEGYVVSGIRGDADNPDDAFVENGA